MENRKLKKIFASPARNSGPQRREPRFVQQSGSRQTLPRRAAEAAELDPHLQNEESHVDFAAGGDSQLQHSQEDSWGKGRTRRCRFSPPSAEGPRQALCAGGML